MAVVLIGYFLIIRLFGLHENYWLRILNGGIISYGIYAAIKKQKSIEKENFEYFYGFATGILTGVVATFIFVSFMGIYLFHIEPPFAEMLMSKIAGTGGTELLLLILTIEGVSSSVVLSLAFMQMFKVTRNILRNNIQNNRHLASKT
jgi:ABC-type sugar transport system permease subunit